MIGSSPFGRLAGSKLIFDKGIFFPWNQSEAMRSEWHPVVSGYKSA